MFFPITPSSVLDLTRDYQLIQALKRDPLVSPLMFDERQLQWMYAFEALLNIDPTLRMDAVPLQSCWYDGLILDCFYYFLLLFGLFQDAVGSYLFGYTLFALIPGLSPLILTILAVIYTVLEAILFYAFEVTFLKEALGIARESTDHGRLLKTRLKQVESMKRIDEALQQMMMLRVPAEEYRQYIALTQALHHHLTLTYDTMQDEEDSWGLCLLRVGILIFGTISSVAGSYFMAHALLELLAASLIGTGLGSLFIGLTIFAGLGFYYSMGTPSILRLVNPDVDDDALLRHTLGAWVEKSMAVLTELQFLCDEFFSSPRRQDMLSASAAAVPALGFSYSCSIR